MGWLEVGIRHCRDPLLACRGMREPMRAHLWRGRGIQRELNWSCGPTASSLVLLLAFMGFSLPSDPIPGTSDGAQPDEGPEQIARPRNQEDVYPFQEVAPSPQLPCRFRFKYFLKPSVLHVEACLLEKVFGKCSGIFPTQPQRHLQCPPWTTHLRQCPVSCRPGMSFPTPLSLAPSQFIPR